MTKYNLHSFFIPVMGTAFTIDTPLKVAKFGISSVISIGDDELCETMRVHYASKYGYDATPVPKKGNNYYRSQRITKYLNVVNAIVQKEFNEIRQQAFTEDSDITSYFELLEDTSALKKEYLRMTNLPEGPEKETAQFALRDKMQAGDIDVNIMTKIDRRTYDDNGEMLPEEFSDALTALKGFAESDLSSGVVFSAGFNRRLYAHCAKFKDFFPDENGVIKKKIILKVSDFRSSVIQGKFLAKKGIWISEHRIESGLNCGGHAFATDGFLMGPILNEFLEQKQGLFTKLKETCNEVLSSLDKPLLQDPHTCVTVQGGIGTSKEREFLLRYYDIAATGWASPFLLVPEVSTLDDETRQLLEKAKGDDFYLSENSPLGVPFNTVRGTQSDIQKQERVEKGRPGSPCPKGFLVSNTEFSKKPVCTASVFYQRRAMEKLDQSGVTGDDYEKAKENIVVKSCLCEDLAASSLINHDISNKRPLKTTVCSGPNLRYFSNTVSFKEMVSHIYGRVNLLNDTYRPNMLVNEFKMYIDHLEKEIQKVLPKLDEKKEKYFNDFLNNLHDGMTYYEDLKLQLFNQVSDYKEKMGDDLTVLQKQLDQLVNGHSFLSIKEPVAV